MLYIGTLHEEQQRFMIVPAQMQRICKKFEVKMTLAYLKKMSLTSYRQNARIEKTERKKKMGEKLEKKQHSNNNTYCVCVNIRDSIFLKENQELRKEYWSDEHTLEQTYAAYCCFTTYLNQIDLNKKRHFRFKIQEPFWLYVASHIVSFGFLGRDQAKGTSFV